MSLAATAVAPSPDRPLRIAVSGASGLVGTAVCQRLGDLGHEVFTLVRRKPKAATELQWSPQKGLLEPTAAEGLDALIHLAGENIAGGRWTRQRKKAILDSRVDGTRALIDSMRELSTPPARLVCASAIGYYGSPGNILVDESSPPGAGFLASVCRQWEAAAQTAEGVVDRVLRLRFGVVLSPRGGALAKMLPPFRFGFGGVVGSGDQFMSWISLDDAAKATVYAATAADPPPIINVVAPNPVSNRNFTRALGSALARPTFLPLPSFMARIMFGEMADEMLLSSIRVDARRLREAGFSFRDPELAQTLKRLL